MGEWISVDRPMRPDSDPEHNLMHRVPVTQLDAYKAGEVVSVKALCGKVWSPDLANDKPLCPICCPPRTTKFAIAA